MLNGNQRVRLERLQRKCIARRSESLSIEYRVITIKELLNDVEHRGLTSTSGTIKHHELLQPLGVTGHDRTNGPFDFVPLGRRVQNTHELVIRVRLTLLKRIIQHLAGIVLFPRFAV